MSDSASVPLSEVSVVIPTYRRPDRLALALAALAHVPGADQVEIVVCDDGSPDEQHDAYQRVVAETELNIRLIRQPNGGPGAARNAAGQAARGALLLFTDDDCLPQPGFIDQHVRDRAPGERIAVQGHIMLPPDTRLTPFMEMVMRGAQFNFSGIADPERVPFTCFYFANCSVWKEDLARAGWFTPHLRLLEDAELAHRLRRAGTRLVYRPEALVYHDHPLELSEYVDTARTAGRLSVEVATMHPELFDALGLWQVADAGLREQYYTSVLRYAFVCGIEDGLEQHVREGALTGTELRGTFERWIASWAAHQTGETRAWRQRAQTLETEVQRRDAQLARVVQEKDDRIAALEAQLTRFNALPPIKLYRRLTAWGKRS